tara:strand:- start:4220 stop:4585 length:366 start_codon:yes stop_codon:yes gene_type:complete
MSYKINPDIKMIRDKDEDMREANAIVDEFSENFMLFNEDVWNIVEKEIDNEKKRRINVSQYYIKDFELEDELMNREKKSKVDKTHYYIKDFELEEYINNTCYPKNIKYPEIYYIKNGEKCG